MRCNRNKCTEISALHIVPNSLENFFWWILPARWWHLSPRIFLVAVSYQASSMVTAKGTKFLFLSLCLSFPQHLIWFSNLLSDQQNWRLIDQHLPRNSHCLLLQLLTNIGWGFILNKTEPFLHYNTSDIWHELPNCQDFWPKSRAMQRLHHWSFW